MKTDYHELRLNCKRQRKSKEKEKSHSALIRYASRLINPLKVIKLLTAVPSVSNMLTNINVQCHLFSPCISLRMPVTPIFYVIFLYFLLYVLHVILESNKKIISRTYIFLYFLCRRPKNTKVIMKFNYGKFEEISISRTITDELP